jgi:pimeloyl-ACP methyl ester carboxylesterase
MNSGAGLTGVDQSGVNETDVDPYLRTCVVLENRVVYYDRGAGIPLVLVHGMFGDHLDWSPVLEPLSEKYRVIAIDLPGFGDSEKSFHPYTPEFFVDSLDAFFQTLDLHRAVLVGNSFGGLLCSLYADAHPQRFAGLALVSSAGMKKYTWLEKEIVAGQFSESRLLALRPELVEPLFAMNFARFTPARAAYLERQRARLSKPDYPAYAHVLAQCMAMSFAVPVVPLLQRMNLPVLLMWGDRDRIFPPELARAALEELPQARLAIIPEASHMPQFDQPERFVLLLEQFVQKLV